MTLEGYLDNQAWPVAKKLVDRLSTISEVIDAQFALVKEGGANNMQVYGELSYVVQYEPKPN